MSKLRDRLRDTARRKRGGLGFAPAAASESAQLLVLAEVAGEDAARAAVAAGAGALIFTGDDAGLADAVRAAGDTPLGHRLEAATADDAAAAAEAGADFFLFDDGRSAADALLERRLGRVLLLDAVDADPDEERLRMLAPLALDAILLPAALDAPTVRDQLRLRRIVELARAPLIFPVGGPVTASTLEVQRDAGAPAVLVPADRANALPAVVEAAQQVRPPREPADDRPEAMLPSLAPTAHDDEDDDDFD